MGRRPAAASWPWSALWCAWLPEAEVPEEIEEPMRAQPARAASCPSRVGDPAGSTSLDVAADDAEIRSFVSPAARPGGMPVSEHQVVALIPRAP